MDTQRLMYFGLLTLGKLYFHGYGERKRLRCAAKCLPGVRDGWVITKE